MDLDAIVIRFIFGLLNDKVDKKVKTDKKTFPKTFHKGNFGTFSRSAHFLKTNSHTFTDDPSYWRPPGHLPISEDYRLTMVRQQAMAWLWRYFDGLITEEKA